MRLPSVLSAVDIPAPELHAARLDGDVYAIDGCFSPIDEIEQPRHRAAALHTGQAPKLIAEQLSAAWVWGALDVPPSHSYFCVAIGARVSHSPARWMTLREVVISEKEVVMLEGLAVTSPTRTVVDLLRFRSHFGTLERTAVRRLVSDAYLVLDDIAETVALRRNLPNKRRTLDRLAQCRSV